MQKKHNKKPRGNKGLFAYFRNFKSIIIDENSGIIKIVINIHKRSIQRICLPLTLLLCPICNNHCIDLVGHTVLEKTKRHIMTNIIFQILEFGSKYCWQTAYNVKQTKYLQTQKQKVSKNNLHPQKHISTK